MTSPKTVSEIGLNLFGGKKGLLDESVPGSDAPTRNTNLRGVEQAVLARRQSTRNESPKSLNDEINPTESTKINLEEVLAPPPRVDVNPESELRIGWTTMSIPPSEIRIAEDRYNEEIPALRARGAALVKTGHGHIRINFPLEFPTVDHANNELREIIAQFRTCPFTTVENDFLSTSILLRRADKGAAAAFQEAREARDAAEQEYRALHSKIVEVVQWFARHDLDSVSAFPVPSRSRLAPGYQPDVNSVLEDIQSARIDGLKEYMSRIARWISTAQTSRFNIPIFTDRLLEARDVVPKAREALRNVFKKVREYNAAAIDAMVAAFDYPNVPIALHQLQAQTVPGFPTRLQANLEAFYFNNTPYTPTMSYMGRTFNPSPDITDSWLLWNQIEHYLRSPQKSSTSASQVAPALGVVDHDDDERGRLFFEYPINEVERVAKDSEHRTPHGRTDVTPDNRKDIEDEYHTVLKTDTLEVLPGTELAQKIIVDQIVVSLENQLAPQPVEGHMYGTLQYMGQTNAKVRIILTVRGANPLDQTSTLQLLHEMKAQSEMVALNFGEKAKRNARIKIENDIVNLFGVHYVLLDRITTRTKAPNVAEVVLDFTEYTSSQEKRENLIVVQTNPVHARNLRTLEFMADIVSAWAHDTSGDQEALKIVRSDGVTGVTGQFPVVMGLVREAIYGRPGAHTNPGNSANPISNGIMTVPVVAEILRHDPNISSRVQRNIPSDPYKEHLKRPTKDLPEDLRAFRERASRSTGLTYGTYREAEKRFVKEALKKYKEGQRLDLLDTAYRQLAKDMIQFWNTKKDPERKNLVYRAGSTIWPVTSKTKMDSSGEIEMPLAPTNFMLSMAVSFLLQGRFPEEAKRLSNEVDRMTSRFKVLRERIAEFDQEFVREQSMYPDLLLPTYGTAYKKLWSEIEAKHGVDMFQVISFNAIKNQEIKDLVRLIVPTYNDLGIKPPWGMKPTHFARTMNDFVDPDFFFFWKKIKDSEPVRQGILQAHDVISQASNKTKEVKPEEIKKNASEAAKKAKLKEEVNSKTRVGKVRPTNVYPEDPTPSETVYTQAPTHTADASSGVPVPISAYQMAGTAPKFKYRTVHAEKQQELDDINPDDEYHRRRLFDASVGSVKDRFSRMITAFPTFKLYLIETDAEEWSLFDDFYGYNAVKSIRIRHHKYTPDIAEIELINVTGNLDRAKATNSDQRRDDLEQRDKSIWGNEAFEDDEERPEIPHFFLESGTPILIKMGYSANEKELETRFTGQIVSVNSGNIIRIVAQSYASELTIPLNEVIEGRNFFYVVDRIMRKSPTLHFGDWSGLEGTINTNTGEILGEKESNEAMQKDRRAMEDAVGDANLRSFRSERPVLYGSNEDVDMRDKLLTERIGGLLGGVKTTLWDSPLGDLAADRKLININLSMERNYRGILSEGAGEPWGIPNIIGIQALQEMVRYMPGFVWGIRPYDHRATLFIGRPEEPYLYTESEKEAEKEWKAQRRKKEKKFETDVGQFLQEFYNSGWGNLFRAYISAKRSPAITGPNFADAAGRFVIREAGKTPGRLLRMGTFGTFGLLENVFGFDLGESGATWIESRAEDTVGVLSDKVTKVAKSESRREEFRAVKEKMGTEAVRLIGGFFFSSYNNDNQIGGMNSAGWVKSVVSVVETSGDFLEDAATFNWSEVLIKEYKAASWLNRTLGSGLSTPPAGILLYNYTDWHNALSVVSGSTGGDADDRIAQATKAFGPLDEESANRRTTMSGKIIPPRNFKIMVNSVMDWAEEWKFFLLTFNAFLQTEADEDLYKSIAEAGKMLADLELGPRMKRFRNHHFVHSSMDMVKNNIQASREFMANRVIVHYPESSEFKKVGENLVVFTGHTGGETLELGFDDDILPSDMVVRVVTERNAITSGQALICAQSNLAEAMRPMYRGEIILRGHEEIWPYDVVWVSDMYNDIHGPVEVESVTDHFDVTGYNVSIVPHALTWVENIAEHIDHSANGAYWGSLVVAGLGLVAAPFTFGASLIVSAGSLVVGDQVTKAYTGKGLVDYTESKMESWILGTGMFGGQQPGVNFHPLVRHGRPWTSGLKGIGDGGWKVRLDKKWRRIKKGWHQFNTALNKHLWGGD